MNQSVSEALCHIITVVVSQHRHLDLRPQGFSQEVGGCLGGVRGVHTMSLGLRTYRGNLEDSTVYTEMEKIIPLEQGQKNQQLIKRAAEFCVQRQ